MYEHLPSLSSSGFVYSVFLMEYHQVSGLGWPSEPARSCKTVSGFGFKTVGQQGLQDLCALLNRWWGAPMFPMIQRSIPNAKTVQAAQ